MSICALSLLDSVGEAWSVPIELRQALIHGSISE
jgi:hypothetical protein